jgi:hypothetical protein
MDEATIFVACLVVEDEESYICEGLDKYEFALST